MAAQQRIQPDAHPTQYRKQRKKPAIPGKRRSERSRVGEMDPADARPGYGSGEKGLEEKKGPGESEGYGR